MAVPILLISVAELLHWLFFWRWAAYLITFGLMLVIAGGAAFLGLRQVKKVMAPERTIETTKSTVAALRHPHDSA
jgi:hypothetical protein